MQLSLPVDTAPLRLLLQAIQASEAVHRIPEAEACRPPDHRTTSTPEAPEGKSCLNTTATLELRKSQFSVLCLHAFKFSIDLKIHHEHLGHA